MGVNDQLLRYLEQDSTANISFSADLQGGSLCVGDSSTANRVQKRPLKHKREWRAKYKMMGEKEVNMTKELAHPIPHMRLGSAAGIL